MNPRRYITAGRKTIFLPGLTSAFRRTAFLLLLWVGILLSSCTTSTRPPAAAPAADTGAAFTESATVHYAKGFTLEYFDHYKVARILNRFSDRGDTLLYYLVQRGTPAPALPAGAQVIEIPVRKMIVTSSMHIGLAEYADAAAAIIGLADFKYVSSPTVRKNMAAGKVVEAGVEGALNDELAISLQPGLVMTTGNPDSRFSRYRTLIDAGLPVMINSEWLETDPLGRSEWVKLVAALTNQEALVNKKFEAAVTEYQRLKALAAGATQKPSAIVGLPFKGTWYVPDGDSYMTKFLLDAGGSYHWSDKKGTGSIPLSFEAVAPVALTADFWFHPSALHTKADITAADNRYAQFRPFLKGTIYNNNKRENDIGANDFWESGAVNPQLILADLIKILHPELLPGHQLYYYKQLP
ncbi:ABC transporter substrate-binding protein [Paraflavisolibacter sp. H34]|uniref:ABC transporter substrate-binding protein n=1 Tax=Huijunlia imazamoxiresistens TaxID=3127457 RepID=UPI003017897A